MKSKLTPTLEVSEGLEAMKALADVRNYQYYQYQTWFRNLLLCYLHAFTQSNYKLEFYENGSIKSVAPKGRQ